MKILILYQLNVSKKNAAKYLVKLDLHWLKLVSTCCHRHTSPGLQENCYLWAKHMLFSCKGAVKFQQSSALRCSTVGLCQQMIMVMYNIIHHHVRHQVRPSVMSATGKVFSTKKKNKSFLLIPKSQVFDFLCR